jgi:hypothetical protein
MLPAMFLVMMKRNKMSTSERNIHILDGVISACKRESDFWKLSKDLQDAQLVARLLQEKEDLETEVVALRAELAERSR